MYCFFNYISKCPQRRMKRKFCVANSKDRIPIPVQTNFNYISDLKQDLNL